MQHCNFSKKRNLRGLRQDKKRSTESNSQASELWCRTRVAHDRYQHDLRRTIHRRYTQFPLDVCKKYSNCKLHSLKVDPRASLLDAFREQLGLTGTKNGCDQGQCGACTMLVDGARINSCLTFALIYQGKEIVKST